MRDWYDGKNTDIKTLENNLIVPQNTVSKREMKSFKNIRLDNFQKIFIDKEKRNEGIEVSKLSQI